MAAAAGAGVGRAAAAAAAAGAPAPKPAKQPTSPARKFAHRRRSACVVLFLITAFAPAPLPEHFTVLDAGRSSIGYYVIGKVHHALHTPLMSVTNAISGIIVVGALLQIGAATTP